MLLALMLLAPMLLAACSESLSEPPPEPGMPAPDVLAPKPDFDDAPTPVAGVEPVPDPLPDPGRLIGMSPAEVQDILSPVSLIRRMDTAQIFQFVNKTCVLDIYFYETALGEGFAASHVTARDRAGGNIDAAECLRALLSPDVWPIGAAARLMPEVVKMPEPAPTTPSTPPIPPPPEG